jgi:protocatechuate 3,4-dioxygenase beta subunit
MRKLLGLILMTGFALSAPQNAAQLATQANPTTVSGTVRIPGTSAAVAGARILLKEGDPKELDRLLHQGSVLTLSLLDGFASRIPADSASANPAPGSEPSHSLRTFSALTDASGRFTFDNVLPGSYWIAAEKENFWSAPLPGMTSSKVDARSVIVDSGKANAPVDLSLLPSTVFSGRVLSPSGEPISNVNVAVYQTIYQPNGHQYLDNGLQIVSTDDRGEYRIFNIPPGQYYVGTAPPSGYLGDTAKSYPVNFYPAGRDARSALLVTAGQSPELSGINIQMSDPPTFTVSGIESSDIPAGLNLSPREPRFALVPRDPQALFEFAGKMLTVKNGLTGSEDRSSGKFRLEGVLPGNYDLIAQVGSDVRGWPFVGRTSIDVIDRDVADVRVSAHPGVDVKVRLSLDGGGAKVPSSITVQLRVRDNWTLPFEGAMLRPGERMAPRRKAGEPAPPPLPLTDASGAFVFNVAEARYDVDVLGLPEDFYVAEVRQGSSVFDDGFTVGSTSPDDLQVLLNSHGARLEGNVADSKQMPVADAVVVLVPPVQRRQNPYLYIAAKSDSTGRFELHGIAPGEYKLFAWKSVPTNSYRNAEFLSLYDLRGKPVSVKESANSSQQLSIIE